MTVTRTVLHDAQGADCYELELPGSLDERSAANLFIPPDRCLHVSAADDIAWTSAGVDRLVWRTALRVPLTFDAVPEPLADAIEGALLRHIDWLTAA